MLPPERQLEILARGVVDLHGRDDLVVRLRAGRPLRVKAGFDPTRPDLHLGHTVLLRKLRQFQDLGHVAVFIVGDFTALVGDPTGKSEMRPLLTPDEVREAAASYQRQAFKVLDRDRVEVEYNSRWLSGLDAARLIELCSRYTVARMLERADFSQRYAEERPIHLHEFLYPLLQGYDSVVVRADVELGGTDQLFNLLVGRDLMPRYGLPPQIVMTTPLLEGLNARLVDGKVVGPKMSKSADNYVGVDEPPKVMLDKLCLIDDRVVWRYLELLSARDPAELAALRREVEGGGRSAREVVEQFAMEMVARFHGEDAAEAALGARRAIAAGALPDEIEELRVVAEGDALWIAKALAAAGLAKSSSEGRRWVEQGAVHLDGERVRDAQLRLERGRRYLVRLGTRQRRLVYLTVA